MFARLCKCASERVSVCNGLVLVFLIACRVKNLMEKRFNKSVKWSCRFLRLITRISVLVRPDPERERAE